MYRKLDEEKTIKTIGVLNSRIEERFPNSGLSRVCKELIDIAKESEEKAAWFSKPNYGVRFFVGLIVVSSIAILIYSSNYIKITAEVFTWGEFIQIMEAGINNLILIGAALLFLVSFEIRLKRKRALEALYELRAIAHVIDMHQLTKDPSKIFIKQVLTPSSPNLSLSPFELTRYLDYSSEMLSLVGKIAAIYGENMKDQIVLSAVNEIESLTTGLSRKIWQKIIILNRLQNEIE
jgi:hypothetical protein